MVHVHDRMLASHSGLCSAFTMYSQAIDGEQLTSTWTVTGFGERRGQQTLKITEQVTTNNDERDVREIVSLYIKGVGLVERREVVRLVGKERRTVSEMRLLRVDDKFVEAGKK